MNITFGPSLRTFSGITGMTQSETLEWANAWVNQPHMFDKQAKPEKTEQERFKSLCEYVRMRNANSVNARIRASIEEDKKEAA